MKQKSFDTIIENLHESRKALLTVKECNELLTASYVMDNWCFYDDWSEYMNQDGQQVLLVFRVIEA